MSDKIFGEGIYFDRPNPNAPEFIKGKVSIKSDKLIPFLQKHTNPSGYVNLTLKESKQGKLYFELDVRTSTLKPMTEEEKARIQALRAGEAAKKEAEINADNIPF